MASLCLPPGTNWCPSRVDVSAPGANAVVRRRRRVRRRRCPRSHFGLYDDFNPNSITPTSLNPRAADEATRRRHLFFFKAAFLPSSLKLTSSSFKLGAGNDLGVATPMLLLLYARRCLAARSAPPTLRWIFAGAQRAQRSLMAPPWSECSDVSVSASR